MHVVSARPSSIAAAADDILRITAELEGHGDNVAASLHGGVTAFVDGASVPIPVGPTLAAAAFVPLLARVLGVAPLDSALWTIVGAMSLAPLVLGQLALVVSSRNRSAYR